MLTARLRDTAPNGTRARADADHGRSLAPNSFGLRPRGSSSPLASIQANCGRQSRRLAARQESAIRHFGRFRVAQGCRRDGAMTLVGLCGSPKVVLSRQRPRTSREIIDFIDVSNSAIPSFDRRYQLIEQVPGGSVLDWPESTRSGQVHTSRLADIPERAYEPLSRCDDDVQLASA